MTKLKSQIFMLSLMGLMTILYIATLNIMLQEVIFSAIAVLVIILSFVMEKIYPYIINWNKNQGDFASDLTSTIFIIGLLDALLKSAIPFVLIAVFSTWREGSIELALWQQIIAVTLIYELTVYISHRLHHQTQWLWAFHALHHSPTRLYTLNNFRFHPLNHTINHIFGMLPVMYIGFSNQAILGYTVIALPILLMQHSNIDFNFGWLNYILNTNQVHRWHHSTKASEGNSNYGRALVIWDQIFGTFKLDNNSAPARVGLFKSNKYYPKTNDFLSQILYPFTPKCCR